MNMRVLIAGLVIALGIAEIAMSTAALYRESITPSSLEPEVRPDQDQRRPE